MSERNCYLFVHFTSDCDEGEQIRFSLSKDGLHWNDVNNGEPVLISNIGEKGARDPFIVRDEKNGKFYIMATDLKIASGKGWKWAQYDASRDLLVWESDDLVNFKGPWAVTVGVEDAGCVWAPEAIYDEEKQAFMVFWASMTPKNDETLAKQKIYRAYTTDFRTFTEPEEYIKRENHVIDTDIVRVDLTNATKEGYVRFSKDETTKNIRTDFGKTLDKDAFENITAPTLEAMPGVEGPICFYIQQIKKWCLLVDRYATHGGYIPLLTDDIIGGKFEVLDESQYDMGKTLKRHGGILAITEEEYKKVACEYGVLD
ncbi:MAG: glycoside hydrolase family 43 protein [Lachnospiraceae bacterium]|nr:glycoside hydrolase family 43 protein [Lachnospiraceae bacterium]